MKSSPGLDFHFVGSQSLQVYPVNPHRKLPPCLNQLAELVLFTRTKEISHSCNSQKTLQVNSGICIKPDTQQRNNPNSKSTLAFLALVINMSLLDQWFPKINVCMLIHHKALLKTSVLAPLWAFLIWWGRSQLQECNKEGVLVASCRLSTLQEW